MNMWYLASPGSQRQNHAMNCGWRRAKEPLHVSLRGSYPMERRVCLDEGQVLPLEVSEPQIRSRRALGRHHRGVNALLSF